MSARMNRNTNKLPTGSAMPTSVVGLHWVTNPRPWWVPAGLESTQGPGAKPVYTRSPFFGAEREWKNDEEGWEVYHSPSYRKKQRRLNRRRNRAYEAEMENYGFEDELVEE